MRKASRLFEIIQILRLAGGPVTAAAIAEQLEVGQRSIYRDIAALQGMRVPIEGGRGIGYVLRPGFTLPPLMFSMEETEAVVLALALLRRSGDAEMKRMAAQVGAKVAGVLPPPLRAALATNALHAWGAEPSATADLALSVMRRAIREEQEIRIRYRDEKGSETERTIRPIALIYYPEAVNVVAWCTSREALRNFRAERIKECLGLDSFFRGQGERLRREWVAGWRSAQGRLDAQGEAGLGLVRSAASSVA